MQPGGTKPCVTDVLGLDCPTISGGQEVLSLPHNHLSKLHEEIEPEFLRVRHERWQAEFKNI